MWSPLTVWLHGVTINATGVLLKGDISITMWGNSVGQQHGATAWNNSHLWGRGWRLVEGTDSENRAWAWWSHNFSMIMWLTLWLSHTFKFIVLVCILSLGCSLQVISFLSSSVVLAESAPLNASNTQAQFELMFSWSQLPWTLELGMVCSTVSVSVHCFRAMPHHHLPIISSFICLPNLILVQLGDLCTAIHPWQIALPTEIPHSHFVHHHGMCTWNAVWYSIWSCKEVSNYLWVLELAYGGEQLECMKAMRVTNIHLIKQMHKAFEQRVHHCPSQDAGEP
jgi:hypothetical protein